MKFDYYKEIRISEYYEVYDFISTGVKGDVVKRVKFEFVEEPKIYNLAFGDITAEGGIDDYSITDNKYMAKVLATIVSIVKLFLEKYTDRIVVFRGSTIERTRLYRMAIGNNLNELLQSFLIYGVYEDGRIEGFIRNNEYAAFLVRKK